MKIKLTLKEKILCTLTIAAALLAVIGLPVALAIWMASNLLGAN